MSSPAPSGTCGSSSTAIQAWSSWGPRIAIQSSSAPSSGSKTLWQNMFPQIRKKFQCRTCHLTRFMNTIFVDRQSLESRRATVEEIKRRTSSSGFPRFWSSRRWCQRWLFVIFKTSQAFDLPRGHHNWRHGPHPLRVFLSLLWVFNLFHLL